MTSNYPYDREANSQADLRAEAVAFLLRHKDKLEGCPILPSQLFDDVYLRSIMPRAFCDILAHVGNWLRARANKRWRGETFSTAEDYIRFMADPDNKAADEALDLWARLVEGGEG